MGGWWDLPRQLWKAQCLNPPWNHKCPTKGTIPAVSISYFGSSRPSRLLPERWGNGASSGDKAHCWQAGTPVQGVLPGAIPGLSLSGPGEGGVGEGTALGQWEQHTFYVGKGAEGSSGTAARLLHVVALGGLVDLEGRAEAGQAQALREGWAGSPSSSMGGLA